MKLGRFIEILEDFDPELEISFFEISNMYDTMMIDISEDFDGVVISIKNLKRNYDKKKTVQ
jgi:hypothetical protein